MVRSSFPGLILSFAVATSLAAQAPVQVGAAAQIRRQYVPPVYPAAAQAAGVSGIVGLRLTIGPDGNVRSALVTKSIPLLDQAALDAVRQWTYEPILLNGVAVPATFEVGVAMPPPVRVGGNVRPPTKIVHADPVFPPDLRFAGVQGVVILELLIGPDGQVADTRILKSVPGLDEAADTAVRQWVFTPTLLNGQPAAILYNVTVTFKIG